MPVNFIKSSVNWKLSVTIKKVHLPHVSNVIYLIAIPIIHAKNRVGQMNSSGGGGLPKSDFICPRGFIKYTAILILYALAGHTQRGGLKTFTGYNGTVEIGLC